jgi:hypothetical protein
MMSLAADRAFVPIAHASEPSNVNNGPRDSSVIQREFALIIGYGKPTAALKRAVLAVAYCMPSCPRSEHASKYSLPIGSIFDVAHLTSSTKNWAAYPRIR